MSELTITWERWHNMPETCSKSISKAHAEHPDHDDMTLCGLRIPAEGNGIVHEHVSTNDNDSCKKCERIIEREERAEAKLMADRKAEYNRRVQVVLKAANCEDWNLYTDCKRVGGYGDDLLVVTKVEKLDFRSGTQYRLECKMIGGKEGVHHLGMVGNGETPDSMTINHGRIRAHWEGYSTMGN
jgi:hypothetical protein